VTAAIRPMRIEDLPAVYRLGTRCYDLHDKPYNYWSVREVADHIEGSPHLCFVAEADGEVVGFALGAPSYEILENTGHLEWVAVDTEHRRDGLATQLIEAVVDALRAPGRQDVVADVSSANEASRTLFARAGFHEGISVTFFTRRL
jgi:ribosomal protein S18 acetylase RimI-like enzyme